MNIRNNIKKVALVSLLTAATALTPTLSVTAFAAGKTLVYNNGTEPRSLDPAKVNGMWELNIMASVFMGLMAETPSAETIPGVATSYDVSDDGLTYTFHLRDSKWSDGVPVTANDFEFGIKRLMDPNTASPNSWLLYLIENGSDVVSGKKAPSELGVTAIDDKTLQFKLNIPAPYFTSMLVHMSTFAAPKHVVEKHGDDWTKLENMVFNGAYTIEKWIPNDHIMLKKNPHFWDADNVKIENVKMLVIKDSATAFKAFRAGELDISSFPTDQISKVKTDYPDAFHSYATLATSYYSFNLRLDKFKDVNVRQALSMAIDRKVYTEKVRKSGIPAYGFVPTGIANYPSPALVSWKDKSMDERRATAKKLLADAGYTADKPLELEIKYRSGDLGKRYTVAIAAMWKAIGVKVTMLNKDSNVVYEDYKKGDFEVASGGWSGDYNDAENFLTLLSKGAGRNNYSAYSNPDYEAAMLAASKETDLVKRAVHLRKAEALIARDQPVAALNYGQFLRVVNPKLKGYVDNPMTQHRFRHMYFAD